MRKFFDYIIMGGYSIPIVVDDEIPKGEIKIENWKKKTINRLRLAIPSSTRYIYDLIKGLTFEGGECVSGLRIRIVEEGKMVIEFKAYYDYTTEIQKELRANAPVGIEYIVVYKGYGR
jgi:hypothetical protein